MDKYMIKKNHLKIATTIDDHDYQPNNIELLETRPFLIITNKVYI